MLGQKVANKFVVNVAKRTAAAGKYIFRNYILQFSIFKHKKYSPLFLQYYGLQNN